MKDYIVIVLVMVALILTTSTVILSIHKDIIDITDCEKYEHVSGIKTASFDGTCYRFINDKLIEVNFEELNNDKAN